MATKEAKKTGRKKETGPVVQIGPDYVETTPEDIQAEEAAWRNLNSEQERNLELVNKQFGDALPYDRSRLENEARFYMQESAVAMLEAGSRLILLKEHEEHGQFMQCLERIGIGDRAARKMMQAAVKFAKRPALAVLGKTKMLELMVEDDDDLEALADGGTVAGLKLDDIEKMTSRELKESLRKERQRRKEESDASERLLSGKDDKINSLERELLERTRRVQNWEGNFSEIALNLQTMTGGAIMNMQQLGEQIQQIQQAVETFDLSKEEVGSIVKPFADHIATLNQYLYELVAEFELNLSIYMPEFTASQLQPAED